MPNLILKWYATQKGVWSESSHTHVPVLNKPVVLAVVHSVPDHQHSMVQASLRAENGGVHTTRVELRDKTWGSKVTHFPITQPNFVYL